MTSTATAAPVLTDRDRGIIARARELAALQAADEIEAHVGRPAPLAYGIALGQAQYVLTELAAIAERLGGAGPEDHRELAAAQVAGPQR